MKLSLVAPFAEAHHGLVTQRAAERHGISKSTWFRATGSGALDLVFPGVARIPGSPRTREQQIAAAVLGAGPGALASHTSAVELWGLARPVEPPHVIVADRRRGLELPGVVIHRPRDLLDLNPVLRSKIPTCCILRLLCDLGAADRGAVAPVLGHFVAIGAVSITALDRAIRAHSRQGRHGIVALREALGEWVIDGKPADSVLEPAMRRLLRAHRIGPVEFHAMCAGYEVDFRLSGTPIVLECDGWAYHARTRAQFQRTTTRDGDLIAAGYVPVHFTYREIMRQPRRVVGRITGALRQFAA
jgi:very-short-patch-repair endonuclease